MAEARYLLAPAAETDLDDIWYYIAQDNEPAADRVLDGLLATIRTLAAQPAIGRSREHLAPDLLSFPALSHTIFYRCGKASIEIVRVLHGARDIPAAFTEES